MKRKLMCLLTIFMLLLPLAAQAGFPPDNEESWNKTVKYRTTRSTTLYSHRYTQSSWETQEEEEAISVFTPIGTLPAGKYVNVISTELCGKREIFYWDGGRRSAWIDADAYTRDTVSITSTSGRKTSIPRKAHGDAAAVRYILSEFLSAEEVEEFVEGMRRGGSGASGSGSSASSGSSGSSGGKTGAASSRSSALPLPEILLRQTGEDGTETKTAVTLVRAGVLCSVVKKDGDEISVPTADLQWERPEGQQPLAVVYAPRTGLATLWRRENGSGALCKLPAGSVVLVLGESGRYTMVLGEGKVGYVLSDALRLCDAAESATARQTSAKAALRLEPRTKGRRLSYIPRGTEVMVIRVEDGWAFVEHGEYAGWVDVSQLSD